MDRRSFLTLAAATALIAPTGAVAQATLDYSEGLVRERLAAGDTVLVDFYARWCGTCRAQSRQIDMLRAENPAYNGAITFVKVDWDQHKNGSLASDLNIPRRSTLVVLKGNQELGRTVAGTSRDTIKGLLDTALASAS